MNKKKMNKNRHPTKNKNWNEAPQMRHRNKQNYSPRST